MALAPQPPAPVRQFSFTDWQVANPTSPPPGDKLDGEYDRADVSISQTIAWVASSLNTDGTLRAGTVGTSQLVSGLFDDVAQGIIDEVQPLVDSAAASATSAFASAGNADTSAGEAETANVAAQVAKTSAEGAAAAADLARLDANSSALTADSKAIDAANAANHAAGDAALAEDWGVVARDWAEHMPDTIPPNTLAVMGVTGDHWSSRWWANKAASYLGGAFAELYLGAWPAPPPSTSTGGPLVPGMIYYNTVSGLPYIWNGTEWVPFYAPSKAYMLTLAYSATAGQTVIVLTTPDMGSNSYALSNTVPEPLDLYVNGVRLPASTSTAGAGDWSVDHATSTVTLTAPLKAGDLVQIDVLAPASSLAPSRVQTQALLDFDINPATDLPGQIDGVKTTFPLALSAPPHDPVAVGSAQELFVSLDGVVQQPGTDYNVGGGNIIFAEAPMLGAKAWASWYGPGAAGGGPGAGFLPLTGGVMTGKLTLDGSTPTLGADAASKSYVDTKTIRLGDVSNVLDFGADPTGVNDSAPAINAAAAVPTAGGGRLKAVYLPAGIYLIKSQIVLNKGQAFYGDAQGASVLQIDDRFSKTDTSVIVCAASPVDPGPTIRDLYIYFVQPNDVASRATFKTLAAGGTSGLTGTGVQYPWAIATSGNSGRIQVQSVAITGAWNGINADAACFWIDGLKISAFNIGIAIGGTVAAAVLDFALVSNVEFWAFGLNTPELKAVFSDGQTIAMRVGCQNGLSASNIACFTAKIIFTADAVGGWFSFTNLLMDAAFSSISILAAYFLQITNLYSTAGTNGLAPAISTAGSVGGSIRTVAISNWYAHSSSPFPLLDTSGGGDFSIVNAYLTHTLTTTSVTRTTAGVLRLSNSRIYAANASAWTVPLVYQNNTGNVQINNVSFLGSSPSGTAIQINQDNTSNLVGFVQLGTGWTNSIAARVNGQYGPWAPTVSPTFTGTITLAGGVPGMSFGAAVGANNTDLSKHLTLHSAGYGISVTASRINYVTPATTGHIFLVGGVDQFSIAGQVTSALPIVANSSLTVTGQLNQNGFAAFSAGAGFGAQAVASATDLSKHIALYGSVNGFSITASRINYVAAAGNSHVFLVNGSDQLTVGATQVSCASALKIGGMIGFNSTNPIAKPTISGVRDANPALASLLTSLSSYGLITDATTVGTGGGGGGGVPEAPTDTAIYGRQGSSTSWLSVLPLTGGAVTGNFSVAGTVSGAGFTSLLSPYALSSSVPAASSTTPLVESGAGAVGTGTTWARADHVHPAGGGGGGLPLTGGTIDGALTVQKTVALSGNSDLYFAVGDATTARNQPLTYSYTVGASSGAVSRLGFNVYANSSGAITRNNTAKGGWFFELDNRDAQNHGDILLRATTAAGVTTSPITFGATGNLIITNNMQVGGVYRTSGGVQVLQARIGGWGGAPVNGSRIAAFDGNTATLVQTSQALAALLTDLRTHGVIGT